MKKFVPLIFFVAALLLMGCQGKGAVGPVPQTSIVGGTSTPIVESTPNGQISATPTPSLPTESISSTQTVVSAITWTPANITPTISLEARPKPRCLKVMPTLPHAALSKGLVVMEGSASTITGTFVLDMATGQFSPLGLPGESQGAHIVSWDRKLVAYISTFFSAENKISREELVIANVRGQRLKAIPWEKGWITIPGWIDNQRLIINLSGLDPQENASRKPATMLVLNPFTGERLILRPDFPGYLDTPSIEIPYWDGWSGVIYDPALSRAIYPRFIGNDSRRFTYAIWSLTNHRLVGSLEDIFAAPADDNSLFPMPRWSPNGSQFVFKGLVATSGDVKFELYRVSRDGQVRQLTHLTGVRWVQDSNLSWSPDDRHVAMFLNSWGVTEQQAQVAVLDTVTLEVIDYCLPVTYAGEGYGGSEPPAPVWSPDGTQFLVVDWDTKDRKRVILVDMVEGFAAQVAENMNPVGWMTAGP